MILELADIRVHPGQQAAFEAALARGAESVVAQAQGYLGHTVHRGIESPERFLLQIRWETLEDHTVGFRGSPAFAEWRSIVGPFFACPPVVEHFDLVPSSKG
jgi:heme-degrading monooxygenase HmoA